MIQNLSVSQSAYFIQFILTKHGTLLGHSDIWWDAGYETRCEGFTV